MLRTQLDELRADLTRDLSRDDEPALLANVERLLAFVGAYGDAEAYTYLDPLSEIVSYRECFRPCVLRFTWAMEERAFDGLMEKRTRTAARIGDLLGANTWGAYARMGETLALFDHSACRRFLMVGCGPVPDSLFYLNDWTAIPGLVGVDRESEAVRRARRLVGAFGLGRIRINEADADALDYAGYDVICCSAFLAPRRAIMERIAATADDHSVVILRDPVATGTLFFESVVATLPSRFAIRARSSGAPGRFMLAYYILDVRPSSS